MKVESNAKELAQFALPSRILSYGKIVKVESNAKELAQFALPRRILSYGKILKVESNARLLLDLHCRCAVVPVGF